MSASAEENGGVNNERLPEIEDPKEMKARLKSRSGAFSTSLYNSIGEGNLAPLDIGLSANVGNTYLLPEGKRLEKTIDGGWWIHYPEEDSTRFQTNQIFEPIEEAEALALAEENSR